MRGWLESLWTKDVSLTILCISAMSFSIQSNVNLKITKGCSTLWKRSYFHMGLPPQDYQHLNRSSFQIVSLVFSSYFQIFTSFQLEGKNWFGSDFEKFCLRWVSLGFALISDDLVSLNIDGSQCGTLNIVPPCVQMLILDFSDASV